jgi:branched-chain amino acid transport system substrate-binding protein
MKTRLALVAAAALLAVTACGSRSTSPDPIRIGVLADCGGLFSRGGTSSTVFDELSVAGAELPLIDHGGHLVGATPSAGLAGAMVAGRPMHLLLGCGDGSVASMFIEARRLVDELGVDILIGPLAADEELALQEYARSRPAVAFVNGSALAHVVDPAPNFYSFHPDGAQWMAGVGSYAYHTLGWRRAAILVGPGTAYDWALAAGFVAEFCSLGGTIIKRIVVPPATADYSQIVAQVPKQGVDGFMVASDTETVLALARAFPDLRRNAARRLVLGLDAFVDSRIGSIGPGAQGLVTGSTFYAPRALAPYVARFRKVFPHGIADLAGGIFDLGYSGAMTAVLQALTVTHGDLGGLQPALAGVTVKAPNGRFRLDSRRQAIGPNFVLALQWPTQKIRVIRTSKDVDPTFGGYFKSNDPPETYQNPACVKGTPPPWAR